MDGVGIFDPQRPATILGRAAAEGRGLRAVFASPLRDRQRLVCGVGTLPTAGTRWRAAGRGAQSVPLAVPDPVPPDWGLTCSGQLIDVPPGRYDWIYLLVEAAPDGARDDRAASDGAAYDSAANNSAANNSAGRGTEEVWLHYEQAVDPEWLYLAEPGVVTRLPVTRQAVLTGLRLPLRTTLRVVAATLVGSLNC